MKKTAHILTITSVFCTVILFTGCEPAKNTPHMASYSSFSSTTSECTHPLEPYWQWDKDDHWHRVTCEHKEFHSPYTPHTMSEWTVSKEATVDEEGQEIRKCTVCTYPEYRSVPKLEKKTEPQPVLNKTPVSDNVQKTKPAPSAESSHTPETSTKSVDSLLRLQTQKRTINTGR